MRNYICDNINSEFRVYLFKLSKKISNVIPTIVQGFSRYYIWLDVIRIYVNLILYYCIRLRLNQFSINVNSSDIYFYIICHAVNLIVVMSIYCKLIFDDINFKLFFILCKKNNAIPAIHPVIYYRINHRVRHGQPIET